MDNNVTFEEKIDSTSMSAKKTNKNRIHPKFNVYLWRSQASLCQTKALGQPIRIFGSPCEFFMKSASN